MFLGEKRIPCLLLSESRDRSSGSAAQTDQETPSATELASEITHGAHTRPKCSEVKSCIALTIDEEVTTRPFSDMS